MAAAAGGPLDVGETSVSVSTTLADPFGTGRDAIVVGGCGDVVVYDGWTGDAAAVPRLVLPDVHGVGGAPGARAVFASDGDAVRWWYELAGPGPVWGEAAVGVEGGRTTVGRFGGGDDDPVDLAVTNGEEVG